MYIKLTKQLDKTYGLPTVGESFSRLFKDHVVDGVAYPRQIIDRWTPKKLLMVGIVIYTENETPEGQRWTTFTDTFKGTKLTRTWEFEDIPPVVDLMPGDEDYDYKALRGRDFPPVGDMIDVIAEYIETGDRTEFDVLQVKRNVIKGKYPKD